MAYGYNSLNYMYLTKQNALNEINLAKEDNNIIFHLALWEVWLSYNLAINAYKSDMKNAGWGLL